MSNELWKREGNKKHIFFVLFLAFFLSFFSFVGDYLCAIEIFRFVVRQYYYAMNRPRCDYVATFLPRYIWNNSSADFLLDQSQKTAFLREYFLFRESFSRDITTKDSTTFIIDYRFFLTFILYIMLL